MVLEPGAAIGHFTMVNPIGLLQLGRNATIGRGNRIVGAQRAPQFSSEPDRISALILEEEASITRDHLIDCSNTVRIGRFTIFAGWRSQILTHSPNFDKSRQVSAPVTIGEYSFIGTGCIILKGVDFPSRSILAAGSVYSRSHAQECTIYAGNPAGPAKPLAPDTAYFRRPAGRMLVEWQDGEQTFGG
jgi:acetyltransferase-like isoleucine patch superfamily enzyme